VNNFTIEANEYLRQNIQAFYHTDYVGYLNPGNPDYINELKNTYNNFSGPKLNNAVQKLKSVLLEDLPSILRILQFNALTVCIVPRAKTNYHPNQLLFKSTIRDVVNQLNGFHDGTDYIIRRTNTKTTHLRANTPNYNNDGAAPYPGIAIETCNISSNVRDKNILLIDDLYTRTVNIDEDAIQALLDKGAHSVTFYAVGRTVYNRF
jgi:hypothetical protein